MTQLDTQYCYLTPISPLSRRTSSPSNPKIFRILTSEDLAKNRFNVLIPIEFNLHQVLLPIVPPCCQRLCRFATITESRTPLRRSAESSAIEETYGNEWTWKYRIASPKVVIILCAAMISCSMDVRSPSSCKIQRVRRHAFAAVCLSVSLRNLLRQRSVSTLNPGDNTYLVGVVSKDNIRRETFGCDQTR